MTNIVRWPFPAALAEHEASFDEPPLAMLDRPFVEAEMAITQYRAPWPLSLALVVAGWVMIGCTVVGLGALAYGVFG